MRLYIVLTRGHNTISIQKKAATKKNSLVTIAIPVHIIIYAKFNDCPREIHFSELFFSFKYRPIL